MAKRVATISIAGLRLSEEFKCFIFLKKIPSVYDDFPRILSPSQVIHFHSQVHVELLKLMMKAGQTNDHHIFVPAFLSARQLPNLSNSTKES